MRIADRTVTHVVTEGDSITGLGLADGSVAALDVVFAQPTPTALDEPLRQLGVSQTETPIGLWTAVDGFGRTSVDGVFAVGNSGSPNALVPIAMGSGAMAALTINGELVAEDVAAASARVAQRQGVDAGVGH